MNFNRTCLLPCPLGREKGIQSSPHNKDCKVYINQTQYFYNVPEAPWIFYIGGRQPAKKWLKNRKERPLEIDDTSHYQKIIVALTEKDRIMEEINNIEIE